MYGYLTPTNGFTLEAWIWRDLVPGGGEVTLFSQVTQAPTGGATLYGRQIWIGLDTATGIMHVKIYRENGTTLLDWVDPNPSGYPDDDGWHHVVFRVDGTAFSFFLDRVETTSTLSGSDMGWNPGILTIGADYAPHRGVFGKNLYDKRMAYVAVYDKALTNSRIDEHYTAGSGGTVYYGDDEVQRMNRIFDWVGIPDHYRRLEEATTTLQGIQVANANPLEEAQNSAESASGYLFADGQTVMVYHNKRHRYNRHNVLTLAESLGAAPEVGMVISTSEAWIYNDIRGKRPYGAEVRMQNIESQNQFGQRGIEFTLSITDPDELLNAVAWMLARYGEDRLRVSGVQFSAHTSTVAAELAMGRVDIGDLITIDELPSPSPVATLEFFVEAVSVDADFKEKTWIVSLDLSPAEIFQTFKICSTELGAGAYIPF